MSYPIKTSMPRKYLNRRRTYLRVTSILLQKACWNIRQTIMWCDMPITERPPHATVLYNKEKCKFDIKVEQILRKRHCNKSKTHIRIYHFLLLGLNRMKLTRAFVQMFGEIYQNHTRYNAVLMRIRACKQITNLRPQHIFIKDGLCSIS